MSAEGGSIKKEVHDLKQQLSKVKHQKELLVKNSEMVEANKKDLENEVHIHVDSDC